MQLDYTPFRKADSPWTPWLILRLGLQYTGYPAFNGGMGNYDGNGRDRRHQVMVAVGIGGTDFGMNWRLLTWKDVVGLLLAIILVVSVFLVYVEFSGFLNLNTSGTKASLGPDWTCTYPGKGDPICVKKQPSN